ncbi:PAS domain-containing sensor histidine kinase, partial [Pseudomonas sp. CCC2.2]|nr:PAS domain-containing sensor histidine kinase [Pseudomonas sp. CCC2.2]
LGRLTSNPDLIVQALDSPEKAEALLNEIGSYAPLRAAAIYDSSGNLIAQLQHGEHLPLPEHYRQIEAWSLTELRSHQVTRLHHG